MKRLILYLMTGLCMVSATAQNVTYNHDAAKQNQFTVAEIGSGSPYSGLVLHLAAQQLQENRRCKKQAVVSHDGGDCRLLAGG